MKYGTSPYQKTKTGSTSAAAVKILMVVDEQVQYTDEAAVLTFMVEI